MALLWLVFGFYRPFEPHYHGKCLSRWADGVLATDDDGTTDSPEIKVRNKKGEEAVQHIGVKALPFALALCRADDSKLKKKLVRWSEDWSKTLHFDIHIRSDFEKHMESVAIFDVLGASAKPVIPSLIEVLQDNNPLIYDTAMQGLHGIGSDSIPPLMEVLTNGSKQGRINAANCLGYYFGTKSEYILRKPLEITNLDYLLSQTNAPAETNVAAKHQ